MNLGTGRGWSVLEVVAATERATGRAIRIIRAPRRPGDPAAVWADAAMAESTLGWRARYSLDDIAASAAAWQSAHPSGYGAPGAAAVTQPG